MTKNHNTGREEFRNLGILCSIFIVMLMIFPNVYAETIENDMGSFTIDETSIEITSYSEELLKVYGTVNSYQKGTRGNVQITLPDGTTDGSLFITTDKGYFESFYPISGDSQIGEYKVLVTYGSQIIGTMTFSIIEKTFTSEEIAESRNLEPETELIEPENEKKFLETIQYDSNVYVISNSGEDCSEIGQWDSRTKTCTLTKNINGFIDITGSNVILNGGNFLVSAEYNSEVLKENGDPRNRIIDVKAKNVTIKNIHVEGFSENGIFGSNNIEIHSVGIGTNSPNLIIKNSSVYNHGVGIGVVPLPEKWEDRDCVIENNKIFSSSLLGISTYGCTIKNNEIFENLMGFSPQADGNNVLKNNHFYDNDVGAKIKNDIITQSTFDENRRGLQQSTGADPKLVQNNNFMGSENEYVRGFENYYHFFDTEEEGCVISFDSNFCNSSLEIVKMGFQVFDLKPWHIRDGWLYDIQVPAHIEIKAKNPDGIQVNFAISATGPAGTEKVTCNPSSDSIFPIGKTQVICSTQNGVVSSFFVTVLEPDLIPKSLPIQSNESASIDISPINLLAKLGLGAIGILAIIVLIKGKKKTRESTNDASGYWEDDTYSNYEDDNEEGDYNQQDYKQNSFSESEFTLKKCYEILELDENATSNEIKSARNRLALQWHPDKHRSPERKKIAEIETKKIITAYEKLREAGKVF